MPRCLVEGLAHASDGAKWEQEIAPIEQAARELRLAFPQEGVRLGVNQIMPSSPFFQELEKLKQGLRHLQTILEMQAERAETLEQCRVRVNDLEAAVSSWQDHKIPKKELGAAKESETEAVLWVEALASSLQLHKNAVVDCPHFYQTA